LTSAGIRSGNYNQVVLARLTNSVDLGANSAVGWAVSTRVYVSGVLTARACSKRNTFPVYESLCVWVASTSTGCGQISSEAYSTASTETSLVSAGGTVLRTGLALPCSC